MRSSISFAIAIAVLVGALTFVLLHGSVVSTVSVSHRDAHDGDARASSALQGEPAQADSAPVLDRSEVQLDGAAGASPSPSPDASVAGASASKLRIEVCTEDGAAVPVTLALDHERGELRAHAADGRFHLLLPHAGRWHLLALAAPPWAPLETELDVDVPHDEAITLKLARGASFAIRLWDGRGGVVPDATVDVTSGDGPATWRRTAITDQRGSAELCGLPQEAALLLVTARADGFAKGHEYVERPWPPLLELTLEGAATLDVDVSDSSGERQAHAVRLHCWDADREAWSCTSAPARFADLRPGEQIFIELPSADQQQFPDCYGPVTLAAHQHVHYHARMPERHEVVLRTFDEHGEPAAARLELTCAGIVAAEVRLPLTPLAVSVATSARLKLWCGTYRLASADGDRTVTSGACFTVGGAREVAVTIAPVSRASPGCDPEGPVR